MQNQVVNFNAKSSDIIEFAGRLFVVLDSFPSEVYLACISSDEANRRYSFKHLFHVKAGFRNEIWQQDRTESLMRRNAEQAIQEHEEHLAEAGLLAKLRQAETEHRSGQARQPTRRPNWTGHGSTNSNRFSN